MHVLGGQYLDIAGGITGILFNDINNNINISVVSYKVQ